MVKDAAKMDVSSEANLMARASENQAKSTFGQAQGAANTASSNANQTYGTLSPLLTSWATAPPGMSANDLASENTAAQQGAGGALAAAKGDYAGKTAQTRNRGAFQGAEDEAVRGALRQGSQNSLNVANQNTALKQRQQMAGIGGLGSLYGENLNSLAQSLGAQNQSTQNLVNSEQNGWFQNLTKLMGVGGQAFAAYEGAH